MTPADIDRACRVAHAALVGDDRVARVPWEDISRTNQRTIQRQVTALAEHWGITEQRDTDLYVALTIIDDARHAISGTGRRIERTEGALYGEDAARLVRLLGQIKHEASVGQPLPHLEIYRNYAGTDALGRTQDALPEVTL